MENASKALIIAGAILLAILIIGLGMLVFNQVSGQVSKANLKTEQAAAFNSKFEAYEGSRKGTEVRALIDLVRTTNNTKDSNEVQTAITINGKSSAADLSTLKAAVKTGSTYTVTMDAYDNEGYITTISYK